MQKIHQSFHVRTLKKGNFHFIIELDAPKIIAKALTTAPKDCAKTLMWCSRAPHWKIKSSVKLFPCLQYDTLYLIWFYKKKIQGHCLE